MKGVLKGFKYITQIFDEEKEKEMQIGLPTDVKHVAHIGLDGPAAESPSWMNKYKGQEKPESTPFDTKVEPVQQRARSAPLDINGNSIDSTSQEPNRDIPNIPKASRRRYSADNLTIETKDLSSKSKGSRRHRRKNSSEGSVGKSGRRRSQRKNSGSTDREGGSRSSCSIGYESGSPLPSPSSPAPRNLPGIPKSSRRKKSKNESSRSSKSRASSGNESTQNSSSRNSPLVEEAKRE